MKRRIGGLHDLASLAQSMRDAAADAAKREAEARERAARDKREREAFVRRVFHPGEAAEVDWAACGSIEIGGRLRKLSVFVFTLCYSLDDPQVIFQRFPGVEGSAYFIGGLGVNYQRANVLATTNLAAFAIQVVGTATGSATLTWQPPTGNTDGSPLSDLAGYRVYWGITQGNYSSSTALSNPGLTSYVIEQLTPATWYFVVTAVNSTGVESNYSNVVSKAVL